MKIKLVFLLIMSMSFTYSQPKKGDANTYSVEYYCPPCGCPDDGITFETPGICQSCNMVYRTRIKGLENKPSVTFPRITAAILLFDYADIMDVTGPMSVFEHAGFNVVTVAKDDKPKRIGANLELKPDYTFVNLPQVNIIMVPGGGPAESNQDTEIISWLKKRNNDTDTMFSVCSGAFFLGLAGILDGLEATTFASLIPSLKLQFPKAIVLNNVKYTNNGHVITSSGLSSGIDASFEVVAKYFGIGQAQDIANHMEYPWKRKNDYARTQLADQYIVVLNNLIRRFANRYTFSEGDMNSWEYRFSLWEGVDVDDFLSFINDELRKTKGYLKSTRNKRTIEAEVKHNILGKGKIELSLSKNMDNIEVKLRARRLQKIEN